MTADLDALKQKTAALGDKIRELKAAADPDKAAIGAAVAELNEAKKQYAEQNGGIGVDGKPYEPPMTKAEKKAKAKAEKAAGGAKPEVAVRSIGKKACFVLDLANIHSLFWNCCRPTRQLMNRRWGN